jgi:hypothetical protein
MSSAPDLDLDLERIELDVVTMAGEDKSDILAMLPSPIWLETFEYL